MNLKGYTCSCCGNYHDELPMSYGYMAPAYYFFAEPKERESRFELSEELCVMDNEHYFIRGCVEMPINGMDEVFIWGVWVSLSETNYWKVKEHGNDSALIDPMFGWFSTQLPSYPETLNLKAKVIHRADGLRPFIELEPTDHPFAVEQRDGISIERVQQIAEQLCLINKSEDSLR
ncbi:hypothetical protein SAMN02799624_05942 [Paenibacillus sp. UNC496MF]|uniref:DUF2199 domain-containing protein n=1 Tax=Paenibacillus sp. UNC496MF TaxID=1502753 RepID=UPI0008E05EF9|nr:DUF2199 domain-containing protein [Paenibacillus sp. UNC496MF]SFJ77627.1 hypothetical protein SAMN02799624_05942 [Paenibacillus sp. UNC496MF]